jgi:diacylglycerol O-acyltransferase-1
VYPRSKSIRVFFIVKRTLELVISLLAMVFLAAQYAFPILKNSLKVLDEGNSLKIAERLLKLSVISLFMWLLMFFAFFHCGLNIIAELMRFGDRSFYLPWWNAKDIAEYWRLWNIPVYKWGKRHVYLTLFINHKTSRFFSILVVFTISALLHEILIGIPTHNLNGIAFMGMMGQIPLILFTNWLAYIRKTLFPSHKDFFDTIGNLIFWISFTIVGQPACILIYYFHWYTDQRGGII